MEKERDKVSCAQRINYFILNILYNLMDKMFSPNCELNLQYFLRTGHKNKLFFSPLNNKKQNMKK